MKRITDYLIELINRLQELLMEIRETFYIWKSKTYLAKWMAKKELEERDKREQP